MTATRQLLSCSNCWYNPLQSGSLGLSVGYCVEHRVVLRRADETTCSRQVRKDLLLDSALAGNVAHRQHYTADAGPQLLAAGNGRVNGHYAEPDATLLRGEQVGAAVADYGEYGTKIESLAQLRALPGARAELALTSLARGYTRRCCDRGGRWTSGVHLLWWTRLRLEQAPKPAIDVRDLRYQLPIRLDRQVELAVWWLMMLRLVLVSDIGAHARDEGHPVADLADLAERAAADTEIPSVSKLSQWIRRVGLPAIDEALPEPRYRELASELHREPPPAL
jgi:hypothetical protein